MTTTSPDLLWPELDAPEHLTAVEAVPLEARGLPATTWAVLRRRALITPDRPAVTFLPDGEHYREGSTATFAELQRRVCRYANTLTGLGVRPHEAVTLLSANCGQLHSALLAAQAVGVAAPVNPWLAPERIQSLIAATGARVLVVAGPELNAEIWRTAITIAEQGGIDALLALQPDRPADSRHEPHPELPDVAGVRVAYLEDLAAVVPDDALQGGEPGADDLAAYFHTGGTTGAPKVAAHTHRNEVHVAWSLAISRALNEDDVVLAGLPLFHVNALMVTTVAPLFQGQHVVWTGPLGYRDMTLYGNIWRVMEHHRIAAMSAVPTVYQVLSQIPVDADISTLVAAAVGAAPLTDAVRTAFETHTGVPLLEGYGLTEAGCVTTRNLPGYARPGSVGQRLPYQQIKAVDVDAGTGAWTDLPAGRTGRLMIKGPAVFPGYLRSGPDGPVPDPTGHVRDGWLDTGDLGAVDDEGFVYLRGRAKDLIIRGGHNIDPATIEEALLSHPAVTGAAAVGRPDAHSGEVPVAYVTLARPVTGDELLAWARDRVTERGAAPKAVHVLDTLPLTLIGKPDKVSLRHDALRRALQEQLDGDDAWAGAVVDVRVPAGGDAAHVYVTRVPRNRHGEVAQRLTSLAVGLPVELHE